MLKIVIEFVIEIGMEQTRLFQCSYPVPVKIGKTQADFFPEVDGAYVARALCMT